MDWRYRLRAPQTAMPAMLCQSTDMRYSEKNYQVFGFNDNGSDSGFVDNFDAVETLIVCSWSAVDGSSVMLDSGTPQDNIRIPL